MVATKAVTLASQASASTSTSASENGFKEVLQKQRKAPSTAVPNENAPHKVVTAAGNPTERAAGAIGGIQAAQKRMEQVMSLASSGRNFSPAELLSFQAKVYQCSQEIDLAGKVVDKAGGGLRQILQTQL